ncbi:MAG: hypothetical protein NUW08_03565, partial [Candidatus Uhrbacteria bacterium]|nr:hypothetical protein [Candidatus Uhrbacteria bacterium]
VAIGLLTIFASSLFVSIGTQLLSATGMHQSLEALSLAREGLEAARSVRDDDWALLATGTHGIVFTDAAWSFGGTSDTNNGFTRAVEVRELSANERQVVTTVSWTSPSNRPRSISLATNLSNWRNVSPPPLLTGNWGNPQTLGTLDLGPGVEGTGVAVRNKLVYMTGIASSNKPNFFVINALDSQNPSMVASLAIGPGSTALALAGNFAYVSNKDSTNQLSIINISVTSSPMNIRNFRLTGNSEEALSIAATGTLVLIGTEGDSGPELYLLDVSDPSMPLIRSTVEIGQNVNRIFIRGDRAYLATSNGTGEFMVVNIANPNVPFISATRNIPDDDTPAKGMYVNDQDNRAYVTRHQDSGVSPEINIYDVTNPDAPVLLGAREFSGDIPSVFAADSLMFLGTDVSNLEFQIFDVTNPLSMTYYSGLNFPQVINDMAFENNIIYAAVRSNDALRIITSQ